MGTFTTRDMGPPWTAEKVQRLPAYPDLPLAEAERMATEWNEGAEAMAKVVAQATADAYANRPPLTSYLRLGNLMTFGAFWVVLAAAARLLLG